MTVQKYDSTWRTPLWLCVNYCNLKKEKKERFESFMQREESELRLGMNILINNLLIIGWLISLLSSAESDL